MLFEQVQLGGVEKNLGYIFGDEESREVAVVDPGMNPQLCIDRVHELRATCRFVLATHSHFDHIAGVEEITRAFDCPFAAHEDVPGVTMPLEDGQEFLVGSLPVRALHCPGHCDDSVLYLIHSAKLLTGDELFVGGVGITRSESQARLHYENLHRMILALPDEIEVYPGHDYGAKPSSTIGEQRRTNPYFQQPDFASFWRLRQNWKQHVRERGLKWG